MGYSENFQYAVTQTLEHEGVFSDHAADPGGKTKYGVTEGVWKAYCSDAHKSAKPIETITVEDAKAVYHALYWDSLRLDLIRDRYVAAEIFDTAVNCGVGTAGRIAQRACNFLRYPQEPALVEDGILGPKSRNAMHALISRGFRLALLHALNGEQYRYYWSIVEGHPARFLHFSRGWMKRLAIAEEAQ